MENIWKAIIISPFLQYTLMKMLNILDNPTPPSCLEFHLNPDNDKPNTNWLY